MKFVDYMIFFSNSKISIFESLFSLLKGVYRTLMVMPMNASMFYKSEQTMCKNVSICENVSLLSLCGSRERNKNVFNFVAFE